MFRKNRNKKIQKKIVVSWKAKVLSYSTLITFPSIFHLAFLSFPFFFSFPPLILQCAAVSRDFSSLREPFSHDFFFSFLLCSFTLHRYIHMRSFQLHFLKNRKQSYCCPTENLFRSLYENSCVFFVLRLSLCFSTIHISIRQVQRTLLKIPPSTERGVNLSSRQEEGTRENNFK